MSFLVCQLLGDSKGQPILESKSILIHCPSQETEVTSIPTRLVENVVITTKGIQDRNNLLLDGRKVENNKVN